MNNDENNDLRVTFETNDLKSHGKSITHSVSDSDAQCVSEFPSIACISHIRSAIELINLES